MTAILASRWPHQIEKHTASIPVDSQKSSKIKKQMLASLQFVKSHSEKERGILDLWMREFFCLTLDAFKMGLEFTKEDREEIGPLIEETILDMDDCLLDIGEGFDINTGPYALRVRSGFQFMIDNFKNFPNGKGDTLKKSFQYFNDSETIEILDKSLAQWKEDPSGCDENVRHTSEILDRPKEVPVSHYWWF